MTGTGIPRVRDPQIDAWRGISILLVVVGHLTEYRFIDHFQTVPFHTLHSASASLIIKNIFLRFISSLPGLGVCVFFVISGSLITKILITEEGSNQNISIWAFYIRRIFRIIPAFYCYLAVMALIANLSSVNITSAALAKSAFFLCDTNVGASCGWLLGHTWSLAVEEQFYLIWPLAFSLSIPAHRPRLLIWTYLLLVTASYLGFATRIWNEPAALGLYFPCIALGALYACSDKFQTIVGRFSNDIWIVSAVILLLIQPLFASFELVGLAMRPLNPLFVSFIFFASLTKHTALARVLAQRWLAGLGLISYSLYLWQQPFTADPRLGLGWPFQWPVLALMVATASYLVVERPLIRAGHRLSSAIIARHQRRRARRQEATAPHLHGQTGTLPS